MSGDDKSHQQRIVADNGHCSLCDGTHYGTGWYHCPFECDQCKVNTNECAEAGCPRNARWKAEQETAESAKPVAVSHEAPRTKYRDFVTGEFRDAAPSSTRPREKGDLVDRLRFFGTLQERGAPNISFDLRLNGVADEMERLLDAYAEEHGRAAEMAASLRAEAVPSARATIDPALIERANKIKETLDEYVERSQNLSVIQMAADAATVIEDLLARADGNGEDVSHDWGVVQELVIEADTPTALRAACTIAFTEHRKGVESYAVENGSLTLLWSDSEGIKLPFRLDDAEAVFEFVSRWLAQAEYEESPDTDGTAKKGFRIENAYSYVFLRVKPTWIVYGK